MLQVCISIFVATSLCSASTPENLTREQKWSDEITTLIRDSVCSRELIPKWPDSEWLKRPLFTPNDAQTFFSSDTITVCVIYDYIFSWISISLYNGIYEKKITIEPMENDHNELAIGVRYDNVLKKLHLSDILPADPYDLTYLYIINWDLNIPEFILDRGNRVILDDYRRFFAYRIIRNSDNTFSVQGYPAELLNLINKSPNLS